MSDNDLIRRGDALKALNWGDIYGRNAQDAIIALPAVQPTVKPLDWLEIQLGQYYEARAIGILYSIRLGSDGVTRWQAGHMGPWHEVASIEAAKAAAQADYDARILSALDMQPTVSPDVAALVEAAEAQLQYMDMCNDKGDLERNMRAALARVKGVM